MGRKTNSAGEWVGNEDEQVLAKKGRERKGGERRRKKWIMMNSIIYLLKLKFKI